MYFQVIAKRHLLCIFCTIGLFVVSFRNYPFHFTKKPAATDKRAYDSLFCNRKEIVLKPFIVWCDPADFVFRYYINRNFLCQGWQQFEFPHFSRINKNAKTLNLCYN